jgi:hypothetical protein
VAVGVGVILGVYVTEGVSVLVDVNTGVGVYVGEGVVLGVRVNVGVWEGASVGVIVAVGVGVGLCAQIKPPLKPIANKSSPKGTRRINERRIIPILGAN